jgi:molybdopterin-guanine dinucleotide biosynthesis protein A
LLRAGDRTEWSGKNGPLSVETQLEPRPLALELREEAGLVEDERLVEAENPLGPECRLEAGFDRPEARGACEEDQRSHRAIVIRYDADMAQILGVVLAGGEGRRMGRPKGSLEWKGRPLAVRAAMALRPICGSVLVSVAPGAVNPAPAFAFVEDARPAGRGPLSGIAAAFAASGRADLLVLACDYPEVETPLLKALVQAAEPEDDLVFPVDAAGRDHPLVAYWRRSAERAVGEALVARHFKVLSLLPDLRVRRVPADALGIEDSRRVLRNLNWPEDLAR